MMTNKRTQNSGGLERQLEQDLALLRDLDAETARAEPPELVDRAVLNMARRAVPSASRRIRIRWLGAFATAAIVVLAVSTVLQQGPQAPPPVGTDDVRLQPPKRTMAERAESKAAQVVDSQAAQRRSALLRAPTESEARSAGAAEPATQLTDEALSEESRIEKFRVDEDRAIESREMEGQAAPKNPAEWIERMLQLQRKHASEELAIELAAFRKTYPDYPLPPELAD
jgi:hypothetical protein